LLKDEIILKSMKLFSLKGYANTGVDEIIKAVGSSKGGFYNHFASKEELFYEVLAKAQRMWRERVLYGLNELESPVGKIIKLLENYRDRYLLDGENFPGGCIFVTFSVELDHQQPQLIEEVNKGFIGLQNMLKRLLKEGIKSGELISEVDPTMMSVLIFAGMLGASVLFGVEKSPESLHKTIQSLIDTINKSKQK
jgi:AcrR family transcriptional regulator